MLQSVALKDLAPCPTNPRAAPDPAKLAELADSIRAVGILQPVVARQRKGKGKKLELVFGHRRLEAAKLAGLAEIPVDVRELDDRQVLELQLVENCNREDVHPMDEAEGLRRLHEDLGVPVEDLAAKVGKSRGHVYARLKLCELSEACQEAFLEGRLTPSTAVLVARIPDAALQERALQRIGGGRNQEPLSARAAQDLVQREFMLQLRGAPFDTNSSELVPTAGACRHCPKRTGNSTDLFGDVRSADVCTDPRCFAAKRDAGWRQQQAEAERKGRVVLSDKEAAKVFRFASSTQTASASAFELLDQPCLDDPKCRTYRKLLGRKHAPPVALARTQDGRVHELVRKTDLRRALAAAGHDFAVTARSAASSVDRHGFTPADRAREDVKREVTLRALGELASKAEKGDVEDVDFWRFLARGFLEGSWHDTIADVVKRRGLATPKTRGEEVLGRLITTAPVHVLRGLVAELVVTRGALARHLIGRPRPFADACRLFGVDVAKLEREARAARKKPTKASGKRRNGKAPAAATEDLEEEGDDQGAVARRIFGEGEAADA